MEKKDYVFLLGWWGAIVILLFFSVKIAAITAFITGSGICLFLAILVWMKRDKARGNK